MGNGSLSTAGKWPDPPSDVRDEPDTVYILAVHGTNVPVFTRLAGDQIALLAWRDKEQAKAFRTEHGLREMVTDVAYDDLERYCARFPARLHAVIELR